jgi:hypothetical protein
VEAHTITVYNIFRLAIPLVIQTRQLNAHRASIGSIGRSIYVRTYPTLLVQPDGSIITVQYNEPRAIIKANLFLFLISTDVMFVLLPLTAASGL